MTDLVLRMGLDNLCVSAVLALVAWAVQVFGTRPRIAHLLWLLVLAKLLMPPLWSVQWIEASWLSTGSTTAPSDLNLPQSVGAAATTLDESLVPAHALSAVLRSDALPAPWVEPAKLVFVLLWSLGSLGVFVGSLFRIFRFHRWLTLASEPAPAALQRVAAELGRRLGLRSVPTVHLSSADLSPMVWWLGSKPRIVLPSSLHVHLDSKELRWVVAHELAHVRRGDHWVRWLEWATSVVFWWNPVAWWARRNLRTQEEICCDALVLSQLQPDPRTYASSLLDAVEYLAYPMFRPPAMASAIDSGGFLERRLTMILSHSSRRATPRWALGLILLFAVVLLPLGVARAQDFDAVGKRLREAVQHGELNAEQARTMMEALRKVAKTSEADGSGRFTKTDFARIQAELRDAVEAGKISSEAARARLDGMRRELAEQNEDTDRSRRDASRALEEELRAIDAELRTAVARGAITKQQAADKLAAIEQERYGDAEAQPARTFGRRTEESYSAIEFELLRAIEAGEISGEDAQKRLSGMRKRLAEMEADVFRDADAAAADAWKQKYRAIEAELRAAVETGKLSKEEARKKLEAVEKEFGDAKRAKAAKAKRSADR